MFAPGLLAAVASLLITISASASAKTPNEVRAVCRSEGRPCVGLVLSGGGARGFAHVGVLQVLEELGVRVDVVTGTSMGSMIGGAYAAGYSAEQIEQIVYSVDWDRMLAVRPERRLLPWRRKAEDARGLSSAAIEVDETGAARLPQAVVPSQELDIFLMRHTGIVSMVNNLSELAIPFAASATDLVSGERVVMRDECTLGTAMRASMSVPGAFAPLDYDGKLLVDGGLVDNLPVELAREMGADVIIAVNVGTPLSGRSELRSVVGVMSQMVNLLTEQNVRRSLRSLRPGDVLLTPDLDGLTSVDLKRSAEIVQRGREAAEASRSALVKYARAKSEWSAWDAQRRRMIESGPQRTEHVLSAIHVEGTQRVPPERVIAAADLPMGQPVSEKDIEESTRRIWAEGFYDSVIYRFEPGPDGTEVLVFEPQERSGSYSTVRIGGSLETDFQENHSYNVLFSHTAHLMNGWGAEWRNEVAFGDKHRFLTEFYQPLGPNTAWFGEAGFSYERTPFDVYEGGEPVMRWRNEQMDAYMMLGRELADLGHAGVSLGWLRTKSRREIGTGSLRGYEGERSTPYMGAEMVLDTLDDVDFPTKGFRLSVEGRLTDRDEKGRSPYIFGTEVLVAKSIGEWTGVMRLENGRSSQSDAFKLGGAFRMSGSPYGRWTGSDYQYGRLQLARRLPKPLLGSESFWVGAALEAGRAYNADGAPGLESSDEAWRSAGSVFAGFDSVVGPLFLVFGRTQNEGNALYFYWGHPQ